MGASCPSLPDQPSTAAVDPSRTLEVCCGVLRSGRSGLHPPTRVDRPSYALLLVRFGSTSSEPYKYPVFCAIIGIGIDRDSIEDKSPNETDVHCFRESASCFLCRRKATLVV